METSEIEINKTPNPKILNLKFVYFGEFFDLIKRRQDTIANTGK